jgi:hypothetical protein
MNPPKSISILSNSRPKRSELASRQERYEMLVYGVCHGAVGVDFFSPEHHEIPHLCHPQVQLPSSWTC